MNGRRDQDALSQTGGLLENGVGDEASRLFIHQDIFPAPGRDMKGAGADHVVENIGIYSGGVHHGPAFIFFVCGLDQIAVRHAGNHFSGNVFSGNVFYFRLKTKLNTIFKGILRQRDGHFERADDASRGRKEHGVYVFGKIGLDFVDFLSLHNAQSGNAVGQPTLIQLLQPSHLIFGKAENQGAVSLERKIQLFGKRVHHPVSFHIQPGLPGAWHRVKARVDNGAVGFRRAAADILFPLQYEHVQIITGQFPCDGAARYPCADYDHICHGYLLSSPPQAALNS